MQTHETLGLDHVRDEYTDAHCRHLFDWYDADGSFVEPGPHPGSREMLWNSISLLRHKGTQERTLAERIILNTPIDSNGFEPITAADLLLTFGERLPGPASAHLLAMVNAHLLNCVEKRFGSGGCNNFTCMETYFLLGRARQPAAAND